MCVKELGTNKLPRLYAFRGLPTADATVAALEHDMKAQALPPYPAEILKTIANHHIPPLNELGSWSGYEYEDVELAVLPLNLHSEYVDDKAPDL